MAITFICDCGQEMVAADDAAGSYMQCGQCGAWQKVPQARGPMPPADEATELSGRANQGFTYQSGNPYQQPQATPNYAQQNAYTPPQNAPYNAHPPYPPYYTPPSYYPTTYARYYPMPIPRRAPGGNAPVVLGVLGIGVHLMDCAMLYTSAGTALILSALALILGFIQIRKKEAEPRYVLNGWLGAALGFVGLVGGVILMVITIQNFLKTAM